MVKLSNRQIKSLIKQTAASINKAAACCPESEVLPAQANVLYQLLRDIENLENR